MNMLIAIKRASLGAGLAGLMGIVIACAATGGSGTIADSDAGLAGQITQRLSMDSAFRDQVYSVEVVGGEVTVRGVVRSEAERMRLLSTIRGTPGVTLVHDRLRVIR